MRIKTTLLTKSGFKIGTFLIVFGFIMGLNAQNSEQHIPQKDTSFTILSDFLKVTKNYPFIQIATSNKPIIATSHQYKKLGNRSLLLDAYISDKEGLKPALIMLHGGGWKSGDKSQMGTLAKELTARGFNCFAVAYRLSPEAKYPAAIEDVQDAIQFIIDNAATYKIDIHKIAVLGCSSGGQMAALIGTKSMFNKNNSPSKVNAIIDIDGILAFKHPESKEKEVAALWLGGTFEEIPYIWNEASALTHTDKNTPPILFINSDFIRFHAGRDDMTKILDSYNILHKTKTISNAPHTFWFYKPWFDETLDAIAAFLNDIFTQ